MQRLWITFLFILLSYSLFVHAKAIFKGPSNETFFVVKINGPSGEAARDLFNMKLSTEVFYLDNKLVYSSSIPIKTTTFPVYYSIILDHHDFPLDDIEDFRVVSVIWQPAYIYEGNVELIEDEINRFDINMRAIKIVLIRGEIVHDRHDYGHDLPATQVKLELIEDRENGHILDQVDFQCPTKTYPCPFVYRFDTSHIKANHNYKLEATLSDRILFRRISTQNSHLLEAIRAITIQSETFQIDLTIDTELTNYKIIVGDFEAQQIY